MIQKIWKKLTSREVILYLVFGVLTTAVDYVVYWLMRNLLGREILMIQISNVIAWIAAVLFAFVTNKSFVFESKSRDASVVLRELATFTGGRLFSLLASMLIIYLGVELLHLDDMISKIASSVVVILMNYFISKFLVFRKS